MQDKRVPDDGQFRVEPVGRHLKRQPAASRQLPVKIPRLTAGSCGNSCFCSVSVHRLGIVVVGLDRNPSNTCCIKTYNWAEKRQYLKNFRVYRH